MIINTETQQIESPRQIRQATGIPLPRNPDAETLAKLTPPRAYVVESEPPAGDVVEPGGYEQGEDGEWRRAWSVRDYTDAERAEQLEQARGAQLREINDAYDEQMRPLISTYPEIEREGWGEQKAEAQAYQAWLDADSAGDPPATPTLDYILAGRNGADGTETLGELVGKVLDNVVRFQAAQEMTGYRHRLEKAIYAAGTVEAVRAVAWESQAG